MSGYPPPGGGPPPQGYPPQGYPPQGGYPYPHQGGGYPPPGGGYPPPGYPPQGYGPPVSNIPKVMGILMLVFGGIGLFSGLMGLATGGTGFGTPPNLPADAMEKLRSFQNVGNLVGVPMAILQCIAGFWALRYKRHAQLLANTYAVVAMVWVVVSIVLMYSWLMPALEKMIPGGRSQDFKAIIMGAMMVGALFGMIWPALIMILMNRRTARDACVN